MKFPSDQVLGEIASPHLVNFASAVGAGWVHGESPFSAITPFSGEEAGRLLAWLHDMESAGFAPEQIERIIHAVVAGRARDNVLTPDLVVSGPDVAGVPTADTHAVVQTLFQEAESEIVIAGYAFHNGKALFERLAERAQARPGLKLIFHVDVPRRANDTSSADAIVMRYAEDFRKRHWPWQPQPDIYFDPRALEEDPKVRACLHAKVIVIDRRKILITSANFTEAAQGRNIELGLLCSIPYLAERVCSYFEGLRKSGQLRRLP